MQSWATYDRLSSSIKGILRGSSRRRRILWLVTSPATPELWHKRSGSTPLLSSVAQSCLTDGNGSLSATSQLVLAKNFLWALLLDCLSKWTRSLNQAHEHRLPRPFFPFLLRPFGTILAQGIAADFEAGILTSEDHGIFLSA